MLKVMGTIYSENKDGFKEVAKALTDAGFQLAYKYENNAEIIKEVVDEPTNEAT